MRLYIVSGISLLKRWTIYYCYCY